MRLKLIELLAAVALTIAAIVAFAKGGAAAGIEVVQAVAAKSLTPKPATGAVYLTLHNAGTEPDALIAISAADAASAMVHRNVNENDVMRMEPVERLELAPGQTIGFKTEGLHIMLVGLKKPLKPGDPVALTLTFEKAGEVKVSAVVGISAD